MQKLNFDKLADIDDPTEWNSGWAKWTPTVIIRLILLLASCLCLVLTVPNGVFDPKVQAITFTIGILGIWRYGWWFTHAVRAQIYQRRAYPRIRSTADKVWDDGWRPNHLHF